MTDAGRDYDVVLWGATGFVGRLVAEHLADRYDRSDLDWAIAGRDREKLAALRADLAEIDPELDGLDVLVGDAADRERLGEIAGRTDAICATVGPYAEYGTNVVDACVERDTDYCDLTGELHWMRETIDEYHETAREKGVRIVHGCGFDSIPSDLGTLLVQDYATEAYGTRCSRVDAYVSASSFEMSGGTYASIVGVYEALSEDPAVRRLLRDPYALSPSGERSGPDGGPQLRPAYDDVIDGWTAPFVMAAVNERVVRRSNAVLDYPWGRDFQYREVLPTGSGPVGAATATATAAATALFGGAMLVPPLREFLVRYVLPESGEGPDRKTIENESFEVRLVGRGREPDSSEAFTVEGRVGADRDPGYGAAPQMVGEAAVCLARGETDTPLDGGVLTPASGIGTPLIDRLRSVGMTFAAE